MCSLDISRFLFKNSFNKILKTFKNFLVVISKPSVLNHEIVINMHQGDIGVAIRDLEFFAYAIIDYFSCLIVFKLF